MRNLLLAGATAAALAGCSWHHDRDRNMESSGTSTPPVSHAQSEPRLTRGTSDDAAVDWSRCDRHPYTPGARDCR